MIAKAHSQGISDALASFNIKSAGAVGDFIRRGVLGEAPRVFTEGMNTFRPGGALHYSNVLWPKHWLGRLGTLGTAAMLPGMMKQDPDEGTGSRLLGGVGSLAGMMYGGTAGGMLGAPIGMALGKSLGHGVGHLLGSTPKDPYQ